jgi:hypothetical protein
MSIPLSPSQYFSIGFVLIVLGHAIYHFAIMRYLKECGIDAGTGRSSIRDWNQLAAYRKARLSNQQPLTWWYVVWAILIILFFDLVGWLAWGVGVVQFSTPSHITQGPGDTPGYTTVFDVIRSGYRQWPFAASGLIFVALGLLMPTLIRIGLLRTSSGKWFRPFVLVFAILWTAATFAGTFIEYRRAVDALRNGGAKVVEGRVAHYWQVPDKSETFDVQGVRFQYGDFGIIAGFNHIASLGGPIREGLPVKIWYWHGEILRLQIKKEPNESVQLLP